MLANGRITQGGARWLPRKQRPILNRISSPHDHFRAATSRSPRHNQRAGLMVVAPTSAQTPAEACSRCRACPGGGAGQHHPAPTRPYRPRYHQHLFAGDRSERDCQRGPLAPTADDARQRSARPINHLGAMPNTAASEDDRFRPRTTAKQARAHMTRRAAKERRSDPRGAPKLWNSYKSPPGRRRRSRQWRRLRSAASQPRHSLTRNAKARVPAGWANDRPGAGVRHDQGLLDAMAPACRPHE